MTQVLSFAPDFTSRWAKPAAVTAAILMFAMTGGAHAQQVFKSPDDAAAALYAAAKTDSNTAALAVFGPDGEDIVSSGDEVSDAGYRAKFIAAYDAKHHVDADGDKKATLIIGDKDFPFPVPIVHAAKGWSFDTEAGREEILARRIGHNELDTIQTCLAYVDAQNDYAQVMHKTAGKAFYAQRFLSTEGKKDGLYWPTQPGEDPSPLGNLVGEATSQGYKPGAGREPYHGYYYKILTEQGPAAPGGEYDYIVKGKMIGGFALVAYPATYRNSGVMTFMVSHDGTVFQKDLGPSTAKLAGKITSFNPDKTWTKADTAQAAQ